MITSVDDIFNATQQITTASLSAGGALVLSDDGTIANVISLAGGFAGAQFLTNAVGLPGGLATGGLYGRLGETDITLAAGTMTGLGASGTVTGAVGSGFEVLNGSGNAATLTLVDNIALEGSFVAAQVTIAPGTGVATAINAVDLQTGATLVATAGAAITANAEVDGAAARFAVAGTLAMGGAELLVVNGGAVQANALFLNGTAGGSTLSVDVAGAIEIGTLADAEAGALLVDTGATLNATGFNDLIGTVVDQGTIALSNAGPDTASLTVYGNMSGGGVVNLGSQDTLQIDGNLTGLSQLNDGTATDVDVMGNLAGTLAISTGTFAVLDVDGTVSGLAGLTIGTEGELSVSGSVAGVGPISIGSLAVADFDSNVSGTGTFALGPQAQAYIDGAIAGFSQITLAGSATLSCPNPGLCRSRSAARRIRST